MAVATSEYKVRIVVDEDSVREVRRQLRSISEQLNALVDRVERLRVEVLDGKDED